MKKYLVVLLLLNFCSGSSGQSIKKYEIGSTGYFAYFYCDPGPFEERYSEDSSIVYTAQCTSDSTTYGVIFVKLTSPISDLSAAENLLVSYLDYLKKTFNISSFAGYGKGHRLRGREDTRGIIDYWKDEARNDWKIKGWTDGKIISVLFARGKKQLPETKVNVFLDGILTPAPSK
jgi:hypothetical protein